MKHGTYSGYVYHGCRCGACGLARKQYKRQGVSRVTAKPAARRHCLICGVSLSVHPFRACWREIR